VNFHAYGVRFQTEGDIAWCAILIVFEIELGSMVG
jgi:hypothetical protein